MDKEVIIDMLEDTDIRKIISIDIKRNVLGIDRITIHYFDNEGKRKQMEKEIIVEGSEE